MKRPERSNLNSLFGYMVARVLAERGLRHTVICPGSRSTPLTFALSRRPEIELIPALDERSAGYFALGLSRSSRLPVAIVVTSGTAVANLFPAVVEASELCQLVVLPVDDDRG